MKYSMFLGITAAIALLIACFIPWAYYPDLDKTFNGFFSEGNAYGKPGKVFIFLAVVSIALFIIPRIWAKRFNMLVVALTIAYAVKSYVLFTACYRGICPDKKFGIFLILISSVIMMIAAVTPDLKLRDSK